MKASADLLSVVLFTVRLVDFGRHFSKNIDLALCEMRKYKRIALVQSRLA